MENTNDIYPKGRCNGYGFHCDGCDNCRAAPAAGTGTAVQPVAYINHDAGSFGFMGSAPEPAHDYLAWKPKDGEELTDDRKLVRLSDHLAALAARAEEARREVREQWHLAYSHDKMLINELREKLKATRSIGSTAGGDAVRKALTELMSIVRIHSADIGESFAWAEMSYADEVLGAHPVEEAAAQADGEPCINSDSWNCKYCRKTASCEALKDARNSAAPTAQPTPPDDERAAFEAWLDRVHGLDSEWIPERNCYKDYPAHLAFQAFRAALRHPPVPNVGGATCFLSWDGKNVSGDKVSINAVRQALHDADTVPELKERIRSMQAAQPTQAGAEPAAAATIEDGVFHDLLASAVTGRISDVQRLVHHIDAAIAAAREEARKLVINEYMGEVLAERDALRARLASAGAGEAVPREPTPAMCAAGRKYQDSCADYMVRATPKGYWQAMYDAARQDSAAADKGEAS